MTNLFNVAVATEMFIPTSIFGSISLTLENKDQQPEYLPTYIPVNTLYFREYSNPTFPDINNHDVQRGAIKTDKDISLTSKSNIISILKNKIAPNRYFRGLAVPASNLASVNLSNALPNVILTSFTSASIASLPPSFLTLSFPILHTNIETDGTLKYSLVFIKKIIESN